MVEDGLLTSKQVDELLELQKKDGTRLLKLVIEKAYVTEQDLAVSMGRVLNTPPVNLARLTVPAEVADVKWVDWSDFRTQVLAGQQPISPWCALQVAELATLDDDPLSWTAAPAAELPPAATTVS